MSTSRQRSPKKKPVKSLKTQESNSKPDIIKIAKALQVVRRANAKHSYRDYVMLTNPGYQRMPYNDLITDTIQAAIDKQVAMIAGEIPAENQYIMFNLPPRHGKSWTVTETLPSWAMGRIKRYKAILTAYSSTLSEDFSKSNSRKTQEHNVFDVTVKSDNQDRTEYSNGSVCVKAGIMGGITGKGANLLLIDDPVKTAEEAQSETYRNKVWKEWEASLSTRLEPPAIVILIMTRWHEDDLAGRLMNPQYGKPLPWNCINLPLEAEDHDIIGRSPGDPLWPERYGKDFIAERKQYPTIFNALYQGRPTSQEGNIIKREWWKYYDKLNIDAMRRVILSVDATFKDSSGSDYVVIQVWGKQQANYYLIDSVRARLDFVATIQAVQNMLTKYPMINAKYVEDKANGSAIISVLNRSIGGFIGINPKGSKQARLSSVSPFIESGNVYLPRLAHFTSDFVEEMASFPNGAHDDQVDAASQALTQLIGVDGNVPGYQDPEVWTHDKKVHKTYASGRNAGKLASWG